MDALRASRRIPGLRRAWPGPRGSLSVEILQGRPDGGALLRAGVIDAHGALELLPYATDPALPGLTPAHEGRLVVHRAGRRAVVLEADRAVKFVRRGRGARLDARRAREIFAGIGLRTAAVVEQGESHCASSLLPGDTLAALGERGLPGWRRLADLWPALARTAPALPAHGPDREAAVLDRWLRHAQEHRAAEHLDSLARRVDRASSLLMDDPGPTIAAHRDLHDKQLLWDGRHLGILDLDTAASAEAALDLGNLAAHVDLMAITGRLTAPTHHRILGLLDDMAARMPTSTRRLRAYTLASRLRLVCVHAFRPDAQRWMPAWLDHCLQNPVSNPLNEWSS